MTTLGNWSREDVWSAIFDLGQSAVLGESICRGRGNGRGADIARPTSALARGPLSVPHYPQRYRMRQGRRWKVTKDTRIKWQRRIFRPPREINRSTVQRDTMYPRTRQLPRGGLTMQVPSPLCNTSLPAGET